MANRSLFAPLAIPEGNNKQEEIYAAGGAVHTVLVSVF